MSLIKGTALVVVFLLAACADGTTPADLLLAQRYDAKTACGKNVLTDRIFEFVQERSGATDEEMALAAVAKAALKAARVRGDDKQAARLQAALLGAYASPGLKIAKGAGYTGADDDYPAIANYIALQYIDTEVRSATTQALIYKTCPEELKP